MLKLFFKRVACFGLCLAMLVMGFAGLAQTETKAVEDNGNPTIWVIGDSTVAAFQDKYYVPRYGWGTQLQNYLDSGVTVKNLALSGRSSKSYLLDPEYKTLLEGMSQGDYLIIGFGHNDEKAEEARYTNPNGDYKTAGSFAKSLYENYIVPAQKAGTTVILTTPIVRRSKTGTFTNSDLHVTSTSGSYAGGDYAQAIRDLGKDLNIPVIDMTSLTKSLYESLGHETTLYLHAWTSSKEASVDSTHTSIWGGKYNAYLIATEIEKQSITGLASHVTATTAPTKEADWDYNHDYVEPTYSNDLADSTLWSAAGVFKPTAFGDIGGASGVSTDNQSFTYDADAKTYTIAAKNNKGKIAAATDAFAMYYYKVPVGSQFSFSATVTVNDFTSNDQVSFGLIARDDMYIDTYISSTMGDYVAAAPLKLTKAAAAWSCFARKSGALTQGTTVASAIAAGNSYEAKIESNSDGYACTFGDAPTVTGGFDFQLTSVDSDYVYVGMFATRNANVTFSNVELVVDGVNVITGEKVEGEKEPEGEKDPEPTVDTSKNGLYFVDGAWVYLNKGVVDKEYAGLTMYNKALWYVSNSTLDKTFTGYAEYEDNTYRVVSGKVDTTATGLKFAGDKWAYCKEGVVQKEYTGLVYYNSDWWYVTNGFLDKEFKGVTPMNGKLWFIRNGKISRENGVTEFEGNVYWITNGAVDTSVTNLLWANGKWYYFRAGVVDWTYNTLAYANNKWWYINNGLLDKTYTGLVPFRNQLWYVTEGVLDKGYTGTTVYEGKTYSVANGIGK